MFLFDIALGLEANDAIPVMRYRTRSRSALYSAMQGISPLPWAASMAGRSSLHPSTMRNGENLAVIASGFSTDVGFTRLNATMSPT